MEILGGSPDEFEQQIRSDTLGAVLQAAGLGKERMRQIERAARELGRTALS